MNATPTRGRFGFRRDRLPSAADYYPTQGIKLIGRGAWRDTICPFHPDTRPSLRVRIETGAFRCMVCGAHGGDVLAFHMQRHGLRFIEAAKALGAWEDGQ
ncbi:MAG TPA: CHC2 zinc finger domain-containing protein [Thiobacillaceae bacterium]|nr:CHC2 zinc finger domain-containing protein [Thiobacillaceae bacterium]